MKCLCCSHYLAEGDLLKSKYPTYVVEHLLDSMETYGFDGYCRELDVLVLEEGCCSIYCKRGD